MRTHILAAFVALALPEAAVQGGLISNITARSGAAGADTAFVLNGSNPCRSVRVDYGDGSVQAHDIERLPVTLRHVYEVPGTYQVRVRGENGCGGGATATVRIGTGIAIRRFQGMDRNGDGQISRAEWQGSAQSFRVHDWNGDGVLSGAEVRALSHAELQEDPDYAPDRAVLNDWSERRFQQLDRNGDNRVTRAEWPYDYEQFSRVDRNRDNIVSRAEFTGSTFDDDRGDQFDYLDLNGNNYIERGEWHSSVEAFRWLDRNNDGVLSRAEVAGTTTGGSDQFDRLDTNRDRVIGANEWQWSRASFDRLDTNRDGRITRAEFGSAGPIGEGGASRPITISGQDRWVDTGIVLRAGDVISVTASGSIRMSADPQDVADPQGARSGRRAKNAPLPNQPAGMLLARIGNAQAMPVGAGREIRAPLGGRLYLGINDDHMPDNDGEFQATITVRR
jgi:Ca2+-binding EF-hand superfamily protein